MLKLPSWQFYPGDWRKDPGVQALDYETRGIWFEILLLMFESENRGKLLLNGLPMPEEALAQILGLDIAKTQQTLSKLLSVGLLSRDKETGTVHKVPAYVRSGKRPSIPLQVRKQVLSVGKCKKCGSPKHLTVDHIIPYSAGGLHGISNFQALCWSCNQKKGPSGHHVR